MLHIFIMLMIISVSICSLTFPDFATPGRTRTLTYTFILKSSRDMSKHDFQKWFSNIYIDFKAMEKYHSIYEFGIRWFIYLFYIFVDLAQFDFFFFTQSMWWLFVATAFRFLIGYINATSERFCSIRHQLNDPGHQWF